MNDGQSRSASKPTVSAIIVCYNEEDNIGRCLNSLRWCDEIVVVDSFSTDRTVEVCQQFTNIVIQREWAGYRDQKAFAHSNVTKDWVLTIDSDEEVTPELQKEILEQLAAADSSCSGFLLPRLAFYLDRWWRRGGWYPDYHIRLFRRELATWGGGLSPTTKLSSTGRCAGCETHCIIFPTEISMTTSNELIALPLFHPRSCAVKVSAGA